MTACYPWKGSRNRDGYGQLKRDGITVGAHRAAYEALFGPVPAGMELDHLCRVRDCVNPLHLEAVTHAENMRRTAGLKPPKTTCDSGHEFTPENTYIRPNGCRTCRQCNKAIKRKARARVAA